MTAEAPSLLDAYGVRQRLLRMTRRYTEHLIAASTDSAAASISPASQLDVVLGLLHKCQALDDSESYLRLLQHFGVLLERSARLDQLDQHLASALAEADLTPAQRVQVASMRVRLLTQLGQREAAQAVLAATWPVVAEFPHLQTELLIREGVLAVTFGDYPAGRQAYERGLALALQQHDAARATIIYNYLGNMLYALDHYEEALSLYQKALEVAHELPDRVHCARAEGGLAMTLDELGRYEEAEEHYRAAQDAAEEAGDLFSILSVELNFSYHASLQGRYAEARNRASRALSLAQQLGDLHRQATAQHRLGRICLETGEYEDALAHLAQALQRRLWLGKPLFIQTTSDVIQQLVQSVESDRTLPPETRQRLLRECQEILEAARAPLPPEN